MKKIMYTSVFTLLGFVLTAQEPGDLNTGFGTLGLSAAIWTDTLTRAYDVAVQPDGDLVVSGYLGNTGSVKQVFALGLNGSGQLQGFGNFSRGYLHDFDEGGRATCVKTLPDNKIMIAGYYSSPAGNHPFAIRLLPDGEIDEGYAENGVYYDDMIGMRVNDIGLYGDEDSYGIVLAGSDVTGYPQMIMVDPQGYLETDFNATGILKYEAHEGYFSDIIIDNENNNLYACIFLSGNMAAIAKYNLPGGSPDILFGDGGIVSSESLAALELTIHGIVLEKDSGVLAAFGEYRHTAGDMDMCAFRLNAADGSFDNSFGVNGWAWLRSAASEENMLAAVQQSDGKYYIGGYSNINGTEDFLLGRINFNGTPDTSFGTGGLVLPALVADQRIESLALSPTENMIYTAGYSYNTDYEAITVAAFHTGYVPEAEPEPEPEPVGFNEDREVSISVYPNPASSTVTVETDVPGEKCLQVYDLTGKEMLNKSFTRERCELDLTFLQNSVYFIKVTSPGKHVTVYKLVKSDN